MQAKNAAWWAALTAPSANWQYGVDVLAADEQTPLEDTTLFDLFASDRLVPDSSQIDLDTSATTHRKFTVQLRNSDGRYLPGPAGYASGGHGSPTALGLAWLSARYRPWIALSTGYSISPAGVVTLTYDTTYLGIYVLSQPEMLVYSYGGVATLTLLDKSALLAKPNLITNATLPTYTAAGGHTAGGFLAGTPFTTVMQTLASSGGIPAVAQQIDPNALTLAEDYTIVEGDDWWTHLQAIAASLSWVCYFDSIGKLRVRADPTTVNLPSVLTLAPGAGSIMSEVDRQTDYTQTYNHMICIGASSKRTGTVRGEAEVQDPANPYYKGNIGDRICYVGKDGKLNDKSPDPNLATTAMATTKAGVYLARHLGQLDQIVVSGRNIPAVEPYDRVTLTVPQAGINMDAMLTANTWRLGHQSGGGMQATYSRWYGVGG